MTLVRLWRGLTEQLPSAFVDWDDDDRAFTINRDNPMAIELWERPDSNHRLVMRSTNELLWVINRTEFTARGIRVYCRPYIDWLRDCIMPDEHLVALWLEAERCWQ